MALTITADAIDGSVNVSAAPPYSILSGTNLLPNLAINELAGLMGIDFENQELVLGFVGKFVLGTISQADPNSNPDASTLNAMLPASGLSKTTPQLNAGELAIIVGINDDLGVVPVPDVDLLILRLTKLDLTDLINAVIANPNSDAIAALNGISLQDILFYWCDVPTGTYYLPDGTVPSTGFKVHGMLSFWGKFDVWGELEFDLSGGFNGSVFLSPITLGEVLSITGAAPPDPNPVPATFKTGGPWLEIATAGPNFLAGSWDITVFDIASTDLSISINEQVFSFSIASNDPDLKDRLEARSNLHFRLVEIAMMLMLPLLAVALAVPPKRSTSALGIFFSIVMVVTYHKINQYAQNMGSQGRIEPELALWLPFLLFVAIIFWMYHVLAHRPGGQPIGALEWAASRTGKAIRRLLPKRRMPV